MLRRHDTILFIIAIGCSNLVLHLVQCFTPVNFISSSTKYTLTRPRTFTPTVFTAPEDSSDLITDGRNNNNGNSVGKLQNGLQSLRLKQARLKTKLIDFSSTIDTSSLKNIPDNVVNAINTGKTITKSTVKSLKTNKIPRKVINVAKTTYENSINVVKGTSTNVKLIKVRTTFINAAKSTYTKSICITKKVKSSINIKAFPEMISSGLLFLPKTITKKQFIIGSVVTFLASTTAILREIKIKAVRKAETLLTDKSNVAADAIDVAVVDDTTMNQDENSMEVVFDEHEAEIISNTIDETEIISNTIDEAEIISNTIDEIEIISNTIDETEIISNKIDETEVISNTMDDTEIISKNINNEADKNIIDNETLNGIFSNERFIVVPDEVVLQDTIAFVDDESKQDVSLDIIETVEQIAADVEMVTKDVNNGANGHSIQKENELNGEIDLSEAVTSDEELVEDENKLSLSYTTARIKNFFMKSKSSDETIPIDNEVVSNQDSTSSSVVATITTPITKKLTTQTSGAIAAVKKSVPSFFRTTDDVQTLNEIRKQPKPIAIEMKLQTKYAAIESLEERAFQILVDLGMVELHTDLVDIAGEWE